MRRLELVTDCAQCLGVCCVATSFEQSDEFAHAKAPGERCRYLTSNSRCSIHSERERRGYSGCVLYDCNGAGPRVSAALPLPEQAGDRHAAFLVVRQIHALIALVRHAADLVCKSHPLLAARLSTHEALLVRSVNEAIQAPGSVDVESLSSSTHALLREVGGSLGDRELARRQLRLLER
ncbi:MAG: hypothetical protein H6718_12585 [Polyangiaceae bacterium]|nr:hypothetical protein [Polyangiaceae bacterium]MCB9606908.1 hypothetical protein [Polyangiaceae bacterium]